jgi:hypothetical protein
MQTLIGPITAFIVSMAVTIGLGIYPTPQAAPRADGVAEADRSAEARGGVEASPLVAATESAVVVAGAPADEPEIHRESAKPIVRTASASSSSVAAKRRAAYYQTFEGRLYFLAQRLGMELRIDRKKVAIYHLRGMPVSPTAPALDELKSLLSRNQYPLDYLVARDTEGKKTLVVTTPEVVRELGPNPTLQAFIEKRPFGGLSEVIAPDTSMSAFTAAFREPIASEAAEMSFAEAIAALQEKSGIAIRIERPDLDAELLSVNDKVLFDPRGREMRAVLFEVLRDLDPQRRHQVIYCYEKAASGRMQLVITTREAAKRTGRSIPADLVDSPDT